MYQAAFDTRVVYGCYLCLIRVSCGGDAMSEASEDGELTRGKSRGKACVAGHVAVDNMDGGSFVLLQLRSICCSIARTCECFQCCYSQTLFQVLLARGTQDADVVV